MAPTSLAAECMCDSVQAPATSTACQVTPLQASKSQLGRVAGTDYVPHVPAITGPRQHFRLLSLVGWQGTISPLCV